MIKNILVPLDGSSGSAVAVEYGAFIAPKLAASLTGLHVIDVYLIHGPAISYTSTIEMPAYSSFTDDAETELNEQADNILNYFHNYCAQKGAPCRAIKNVGTIKSSIIEEAENADLVVMAKKGDHFHLAESGLVGSVTEVVVRRSGKPVLVTPGSFQSIERIGLAYDGSPSASAALSLALEISQQAGWEMTIIIVAPNTAKAKELSAQVDILVQKGLACCEVVISENRNALALLKFIGRKSIDLLLMGAFGHNRLRELILGSTTSQLLQESPIPALLVRDPLKIKKRSGKRKDEREKINAFLAKMQ